MAAVQQLLLLLLSLAAVLSSAAAQNNTTVAPASPPSDSSDGPPIGPIVGGVIGGIALIAIVVLAVTAKRKHDAAAGAAASSATRKPRVGLHDPYAADQFGYCHLHYAVVTHDNVALELLLSAQAKQPEEPAAKKASVAETVIAMQGVGADGNPAQTLDAQGNSLMMWAARVGNIRAMRMLKDKGCDVNHVNKDGQSALHWACEGPENLEVVSTLLSFQANMDTADAEGSTALAYAARAGSANTAAKLLDAHADMNTVDDDEKSPLTVAASMGYTAVVSTIVTRRKTKVNVHDKLGWTPLHWACAINDVGSVVALIDARKPTLNVQNKKGETPLHLAARENNTDVIRALLLKRSNDLVQPLVEQQSLEGKTALDYAKEKGAEAAADMLQAWSAGALSEAGSGASQLHAASPGKSDLASSPNGSIAGAVPGSDTLDSDVSMSPHHRLHASVSPALDAQRAKIELVQSQIKTLRNLASHTVLCTNAMGDILQIKMEENLSALTPKQLDVLRKRLDKELERAALTLHSEQGLFVAPYTSEEMDELASLDVPDLQASPNSSAGLSPPSTVLQTTTAMY